MVSNKEVKHAKASFIILNVLKPNRKACEGKGGGGNGREEEGTEGKGNEQYNFNPGEIHSSPWCEITGKGGMLNGASNTLDGNVRPGGIFQSQDCQNNLS